MENYNKGDGDVGIKLSDYIENTEEAISNEEWCKLHIHSLLDNGEINEKLAEELFNDIPTLTEEMAWNAIKVYENHYSISTKEFAEKFKANDYEGRPDEQIWYQYSVGLGLVE